jgi:hypothetical protein
MPNSGLRDALTTLLNIALPNSEADFDLRKQALQVLAMGVGTYLTFLRVRTQVQSALESTPGYQGSPQVYSDYTRFKLEADDWLVKLSQRIEDLTTERLGLVGPLVHGEDHNYCADAVSCSRAYAESGFWTFTDDEPGTGNQGKWQNTSVQKFKCGQLYYEAVDHKGDAENARRNYLAKVANELDDAFGGVTAMIAKYQANLASWVEGLTPRAPTTAPKVDHGAGSWKAKTPQGSSWVKGAKVRYAVTFSNPSGSSAQGPWSGWIEIGDDAFPTVVDVPTDPLNLATVRKVHRQFTSPSGVVGPVGIAKMIQDDQTKSFVDDAP